MDENTFFSCCECNPHAILKVDLSKLSGYRTLNEEELRAYYEFHKDRKCGYCKNMIEPGSYLKDNKE